jgi:hypothetical protein
MNAKELADDLESRMPAGYWTPPELLAEAANMIRQQQDLLDGADVVIKELQDRLGKKIDEIEALRKAEVTQKDLCKAEPVAWTNAYCLEMVKEDGESNMWWMPDLAEDIPLFTRPAKTLTDEALIESLAKLEHEQWIKWASTIMQTEKISEGRIARWKDCFKPYSELSEEMKEFDREWARKTLAILRNVNE